MSKSAPEKLNDETRIFTCALCKSVFRYETGLKHHMKFHKKSSTVLTEKLIVFTENGRRVEFQEYATSSNQDYMKYHCDKCTFVGSNGDNLKSHKESLHKENETEYQNKLTDEVYDILSSEIIIRPPGRS